ncbi:hypothetical protein NDU88_004199 [Pleurodeles waltl]|uniref:Uncharacterized protein n=1 Tax=Pleurodeles waltl TaxID=8319 RepID=A0AAV7WTW6_PLEWA|nr:hypothetical protein NDU88_004199 [Pleurodeles waltl]
MEAVADPAGPCPEARDQQQLARKSESQTARGGEWRVDTGGLNQQSAAKQHSPSVVAQMISLSHASSLVQEWAPCCPQSPLEPRGRGPVRLLALVPIPAAAPGVQRLR